MPEQDGLFPEVMPAERDALGRTNHGLPNNGNGKPPGALTRVRRYKALEQVAQTHKIEILEAIVAEAKSGNMIAAKLVLDRIWPAPRSQAIQLDIPRTETPADLLRTMHEIWQRITSGELHPDEGAMLAETLKHMIQAYAIEPFTAGQAPAIESQSGRELLTERLIRAIEARKQIAEAQKNEPAQADDAA